MALTLILNVTQECKPMDHSNLAKMTKTSYYYEEETDGNGAIKVPSINGLLYLILLLIKDLSFCVYMYRLITYR